MYSKRLQHSTPWTRRNIVESSGLNSRVPGDNYHLLSGGVQILENSKDGFRPSTDTII
jgi:hypothetical protein